MSSFGQPLHSTQGKLQAVENIISKYKETHGGKERVTKESVLVLENISGTFKIVDLVDDHPLRRSQRKSYLHQPALKKDRESLDAIISLNMFKEGANWIWADRSIIAGTRSSLVDIIQMIGRVFRDAEGKKHAEVIQLLPFSLDQKNEIEFRTNLNDYLKAIYASLILENILDPVQIRLPKQSREKAVVLNM